MEYDALCTKHARARESHDQKHTNSMVYGGEYLSNLYNQRTHGPVYDCQLLFHQIHGLLRQPRDITSN
jgi:hypothetical protein